MQFEVSNSRFSRLCIIAGVLLLFAGYAITTASAKKDGTGIQTTTLKDNKLGCSCHGGGVRSTATTVTITLPANANPGETVTGTITVKNTTEVAAGVCIAVSKGTLMPGPGLHKVGTALTHTAPKNLDAAHTATWTFTYIAPNSNVVDSIYANGNAVNLNDQEDVGDQWNWAKTVGVVVGGSAVVRSSENISPNFDLSIAPNPAHNFARITLAGQATSSDLNLYDASGRFVKNIGMARSGTREVTVNTSDLTNGTYFLRAQSAGAVAQTKLVVSH